MYMHCNADKYKTNIMNFKLYISVGTNNMECVADSSTGPVPPVRMQRHLNCTSPSVDIPLQFLKCQHTNMHYQIKQHC